MASNTHILYEYHNVNRIDFIVNLVRLIIKTLSKELDIIVF